MATEHGDDNDKLYRFQVLSMNKSPVYFPQGCAVFAKHHNVDRGYNGVGKNSKTHGPKGTFGAYLSQAEVLPLSHLNLFLQQQRIDSYADVVAIHCDWRFIGFVEVAVKYTELSTLLTFGFHGEMMTILDYWGAPSTVYELGFCFGLEKSKGVGFANDHGHIQIRPVQTIQHTAYPDELCTLDTHGYSRGADLVKADGKKFDGTELGPEDFANYTWADRIVSPVYRAAVPNTQSNRLAGEDKSQYQRPDGKPKVQRQPSELYVSSGNVETDAKALNDCRKLCLALIKGKHFLGQT